MATRELISIREYARRNGCSDTNIRKIIAQGRIVNGYVEQDGKRWIDPVIADEEWLLNKRSTVMERGDGARLAGAKGRTTMAPINPEPDPIPVIESPAANARAQEENYKKARTAKAVFEAKNAELDYKERLGELVSKKSVYNALYGFGQQIRDAVQSIPNRVIDDILAAPSRVDAHNILKKAIDEALVKLSETGSIKF
jgi:hypothetical protein